MTTLGGGVLKLLLLTAQRKTEILSLRWEDIDGRWWTIPSDRSKNGLPHRVFLSDAAMTALNEVRAAASQPSDWVFPSPSGNGHVRSIQKATERVRLRCNVSFRAHDLRRTAASQMASMRVPRLTISKILNHAEPGVTAVYDRYGYDHEKQEALAAWARRLDGIIVGQSGGNVVPFARS